MKIQIDLSTEANKKLKIEKVKRNHKDIKETAKEILEKALEELRC